MIQRKRDRGEIERETERQGERERICRVFSRQQLPEAYYEVEGKNQNLPR
jgi:hypothetical protein